MHLLAETVIMVAGYPRLVDVIAHSGIGNAGEEGESTSHRGLMGDIGIEVVLCKRKVTAVDALAY